MNTKKWLRVLIFIIGVSLIFYLLILGNTKTKRLFVTKNELVEIETLGDQLYLLEPDWTVEISGNQQIYSTELQISIGKTFAGLYLPRAAFVELFVNYSAENNFLDGIHLIHLFEPMEQEQNILLEIHLPLDPNENISAAQLYIGKYDALINAGYTETILHLFMIGLSFTILIIIISLFLQKPSEKYLLPLAMLAYSIFGHVLLRVFPGLTEIFLVNFFLMGTIRLPFLSAEFNYFLYEMVFNCFIAYLNYLIIKNFVTVKILNIDYIYFILIGALGLILFLDESQYATAPFNFLLFIGLLVTTVIIKGDYSQKTHPITLLIGAIITMALELFIAVCGEGIIPHGNIDLMFSLGGIPPSSYAIIFTIAVTGIFARKFAESEILSVELNNLNRNLQLIVKERTSELEAAYESLENEQKQKDIFTSNMVHSLKTPLFSIAGFADMAQEALEKSPEKAKKFLDLINSNADFVVKLVNNLFLSFRLENKQVNYLFEEVNLCSMMKNIHTISLPQSQRKEIDIHLEIIDYPIYIKCDLYYLTLAIQNIVDNAIRHTPQGGEIILSLKDLEEQIQIVIKDNGEGIPDKVIDRIFDRYYSHSKKRKASSGLGLSISKDVITAFGGEIQVCNNPDKGAKFTIILQKPNKTVASTHLS